MTPQEFIEPYDSPEHDVDMTDIEEESFLMETSDEDGSEYSLGSDEENSMDIQIEEPLEETSDDSDSGSDADSDADSDSELDVRDRFMVMPKRREQIERLKATKVQFKYYERLPPDLILHVLRHTSPDSLQSLIRSGHVTAETWSRNKLAVYRGIQEETFSDFTKLFGIVGSEGSEEPSKLCRNFQIAEQSLRILDQAKAIDTRMMTERKAKYGNDRLWRQLALLELMKEHLDEEVDAVSRSQLAFSAPEAPTVRQGLLALWQMRWETNALLAEKEPQQMPIRDIVKRIVQVFENQPADDRCVAAKIVSLVVSKVIEHVNFNGAGKKWISFYYRFVTSQPLPPGDLIRWIHGAIVAFIVRFLLVHGVAETLRLCTPSHTEGIEDIAQKHVMCFSNLLKEKMVQDQHGTSNDGIEIVELGLEVARGMKLDIPRLLDCIGKSN